MSVSRTCDICGMEIGPDSCYYHIFNDDYCCSCVKNCLVDPKNTQALVIVPPPDAAEKLAEQLREVPVTSAYNSDHLWQPPQEKEQGRLMCVHYPTKEEREAGFSVEFREAPLDPLDVSGARARVSSRKGQSHEFSGVPLPEGMTVEGMLDSAQVAELLGIRQGVLSRRTKVRKIRPYSVNGKYYYTDDMLDELDRGVQKRRARAFCL